MAEMMKFGDFASFRYGKMPIKKKITESGKYPIYSGYRYVGFYDEYNTEADQLIIVARGVGGTGDVKLTKDRCYLTNLSIAANIDSNVVLPEYLYYYFKPRSLRYLDSGSAQSQITISDLERVIIPIPPLSDQKAICSYLKLLDVKIQNNKNINENLQQQLHVLYLRLFCDSAMDTPLGDVVATTSGGTPSRKHDEYYSDSSICWVKSKELLENYIHETEEHINDLAIKKSSAKLLPKHSVLIAMYGATVGAYGVISKPMTCNQAVCALLCNENYPYTYLFQIAYESQQKFINLAVGSAQQNISQVLIKQLNLHSDLDIIQRFHDLALPMHQEIEFLQAENISLSNLRNKLLPKLMSGELDVSSIDL